MLNHFLKISLVLMIFSIGCNKSATNLVDTSNSLPMQYTIVKCIDNNSFSLKLVTYLVRDTLAVDDYKNEPYSSPIIIDQGLSFYGEGKLLKKCSLQLGRIKIKTITDSVITILHTPIYNICTVKGKDQDYYVIEGAEYDICMGTDCLEFIGIYSMSGNIVYEGHPGEDKVLQKLLAENQIEINKSTNCVKVDEFFREETDN